MFEKLHWKYHYAMVDHCLEVEYIDDLFWPMPEGGNKDVMSSLRNLKHWDNGGVTNHQNGGNDQP